LTYLVAEIFISPLTNAIIPPFTSKVGKVLVLSKKVTISPLKKGGEYLIKYSKLPRFMEVEGGEVYSFEVGGKRGDVIEALSDISDRVVFNTKWEVIDVELREVKYELREKIDVVVKTPALIIDPLNKSKRKRFTNFFAFTFAVNFMDHLGLTREEYKKMIIELEEKVTEEPSKVSYVTVIYAGKEIVGLVGELRYRVKKADDRILGAIENAIAKGIGSSRRNGFGRVEVR
jgi:CRISPR-associated endoribonuclease Cas6